MNGFQTLDSFLLPPPLSTALAVLMTFGLLGGGRWMVRLLRLPKGPVVTGAAMIMATALCGQIIFFCAWTNCLSHWSLKPLGFGLALGGLVTLGRSLGYWACELPRLRQWERSLGGVQKLIWTLVLATALATVLSSLGPPTDVDSLDYHLGEPLTILRDGGIDARPERICSRLVGLGEYVNLLGLVAGTDVLGACLQAAGLVMILTVLTSLTTRSSNRLLIIVLCLGIPLVLPQVSTQKHQLLPTAANLTALIIVGGLRRDFNPRAMVLACGCVFFAISCKYSFVLTGLVILGAAATVAWRHRRHGFFIGSCLGSYILLFLPHNIIKLRLFGDPLSPLFEALKLKGDPAVMSLLQSMRHYTGVGVPFPLNLVLPHGAGEVTTVLGLGTVVLAAVAWALVRDRAHVDGFYAWCAMLSIVIVSVLSQRTARFYLEPMLWGVASLANSSEIPLRRLIVPLSAVQLAGNFLLASVISVSLLPGILSTTQRTRVMERCAYGYTVMRWLDERLPAQATVLARLRCSALMPRRFVSGDLLYWLDLRDPDSWQQIRQAFGSRSVDYLLLPPDDPVFARLTAGGCEVEKVDSQTLPIVSRNPYNTVNASFILYRMHQPFGDCLQRKAPSPSGRNL